MLIQAGRERVVPVLMTALTSGIALVPILLSPEAPGRELLYPVASVIVGGLFSTTLLDLLLTPGVFWLFGREAAEAHKHRFDPGDASLDEIAGQLEAEFPTENP
jgi:Cu/Ag efflux pump CusA